MTHPLAATVSGMLRAILGLILVGTSAAAATPPEPCAGFSWDVSGEQALFAGAATAEPAGQARTTAPTLIPDHLYRLELMPGGQVAFGAAPGKPATEWAFAGLALLSVGRSGPYRISVDQPLWIDVVAEGQLLKPVDYEGSHSCEAPRKIVVFDLVAGRPLLLQLSGAANPAVRITVTAAPGA